MTENTRLKVNGENHLEIGGVDCVDLVKEYGSPLYVMDEMVIRENCRIYKNAIDKYYNGRGLALYASKAFCTLAACRIAHQEGLGLDVVSGGELFTALRAGFPAEKIYFHGNNKTMEEITFAIDNNIGRFVVDNIYELENINNIAVEKGRIIDVAFRIKPGVEAHTHEFIQTGQIDSKFGVALENGEAHEIMKIASVKKNINVVGVHCHIGSQIFDLAPFQRAAEIMLDFIADIRENFGICIKELNLGGGFGIKYTSEDDPIPYDSYIRSVSETVRRVCNEKGIEQPFILMEPGRSIAAPAGITLYTVGGVKDIKNVRKYVSIDGGMNDNPRYALYESKYEALIANRANAERSELVAIAGKCCESGDLIAKDILMPDITVGDIIAVLATGAYNYSMSMNYNRIARPPVILVKEGKSRVIVKREDFGDLVRNDIIPEDL